jgi:hypothetical protein
MLLVDVIYRKTNQASRLQLIGHAPAPDGEALTASFLGAGDRCAAGCAALAAESKPA